MGKAEAEKLAALQAALAEAKSDPSTTLEKIRQLMEPEPKKIKANPPKKRESKTTCQKLGAILQTTAIVTVELNLTANLETFFSACTSSEKIDHVKDQIKSTTRSLKLCLADQALDRLLETEKIPDRD